ncbi:MAG: selenocysteine-specific translation elongation factor [Phycisphaerae bacterium]|nr:selenocysteine-specific translation elongation factor [Phycisphaerae bacterium]
MTGGTEESPATTSDRRQFCILGTAGHIDHGKSALVKALTGTDPDRLPEEQARGMTIELGFAHLSFPDRDGGGGSTLVEIVDVPGHERFVRTMVAGATGIDLGMLLVAADDGVMPQTREHVEILDLLGVRSGLVAISKVDLVHSDRVEAVQEEIASLLRATTLHDWPIVSTSTKTGQGVEEVRAWIGELAADLPHREASSIFRLAIDRVFAIRGRGTVVTGSVLEGKTAAGATLELQPAGLSCKVREVQLHGRTVQDIGASQRAALNLTGIDREKIGRGMELATPGYLTAARYVDAKVRMLARRQKPFPSHRLARVCMGTSEAIAALVVAGGSQIEPGAEAPAQLRFSRPVVASFGQRFILRNETAQATIGGGYVVRPISRRFRPSHPEEIEALERAESADAFVRYTEAIRRAGFESRRAERLACEVGVEPAEVAGLERRLEQADVLVSIGGERVHHATIDAIEQRALAYLKAHHAANPTEPGVLRDRFVGWTDKRSARGCGKPILARLEGAGLIHTSGPYVAHHEFRPALSPEDAALLEQLVAEIAAAGFDPPAWPALKTASKLSKQRSKMLEDLAKCEPRLDMIAPQKYMSVEAIARLKQTVTELGKGRPFKLAEVRDALKLSRRAVQPMLEYLDRIQFTRRVGDERVLLEARS